MADSKTLAHHGVLGMHWGQHKSAEPLKERTESLTAKLKNGGTLGLSGDKTPPLAKFAAALSPKARAAINNSLNFTLKNDRGQTVGDMALYKDSPTSLNVVWVGVNKDHRGSGYATAAMHAAISIAKKQNLKTVTLEVPGDSPDARHIYEKLGFVATGTLGRPSDVWGGLTKMSLDLSNTSVKHSLGGEMADSKSAEEFILAHHGVLGQKWGQHKAGGGVIKAPRQPTRLTPHQDHTDRVSLTRNKTSSLSTAELKKVNDRLQTEQQYRKLNPGTISKGKKITLGVIAGIGTGVTLYNQINSPAGKLVISAGKKAYSKIGMRLGETVMSAL